MLKKAWRSFRHDTLSNSVLTFLRAFFEELERVPGAKKPLKPEDGPVMLSIPTACHLLKILQEYGKIISKSQGFRDLVAMDKPIMAQLAANIEAAIYVEDCPKQELKKEYQKRYGISL